MAGPISHRSFFAETIFTRRGPVARSAFIKPMHPKTEILPEPLSIERILKAGWVGQLKVHGHRAQIHIPSDPQEPVIAYTRQGKLHRKPLSASMVSELCRLFRPQKSWNVIDAEWLKEEEKLFVFDFIKREGEVLRRLTFPQRFKLLPRAFLSPHLSVLPLFRDLPSCLKALQSNLPHLEGLVFKSSTSPGFSDTSIVRCRKKKPGK